MSADQSETTDPTRKDSLHMVPPTTPERVTAAAMKLPSGLVLFTEAPGRHHNVFWCLHEAGIPIAFTDDHDQGFITSSGRYVTRQEAWDIAARVGQIIGTPPVPGTLFSEDVW